MGGIVLQVEKFDTRAPALSAKVFQPALTVPLLLFLLLNLFTADRSPPVWQDEVMFADPAVNFITGHGWTTSAFPHEFFAEPYIGNAPLYSMLLVPWFKIWGVNPIAARSLNYFLVVASVSFLLAACNRFRLFQSAAAKLLFICLILGSYGMAFSYRSGRYDMTCLFLLASIFYASSLRASFLKIITIFISAFLLPVAGVQMIPLLLILAFITVLFFGRRYLQEILLAFAGVAAAVAAMALWLARNHLLGRFLTVIRASSNISDGLSPRIAQIVEGLTTDPSGLLLIAVLIATLLLNWRNLRIRKVVSFALACGILIPVGLGVSGHCPIYYSWMRFVPMAISCAIIFELFAASKKSIPWLFALALLPAALGLPARMAVLFGEWNLRDPRRVNQFVTQQIQSDDVVYCTWAGYYPAKQTAKEVYMVEYDLGGDPRKPSITAIIVDERFVSDALKKVGGDWREVARLSPSAIDPHRRATLASLYRLVLFRRK